VGAVGVRQVSGAAATAPVLRRLVARRPGVQCVPGLQLTGAGPSTTDAYHSGAFTAARWAVHLADGNARAAWT
jgi:hypothetical protein